MSKSFDAVHRGYGRVLEGCGLIAGIGAFVMMVLVVANSLMRKAFNLPIQGTLEVTESLLTIIIFLAIGYTQLHKGHIRVVVMTRHLPLRVQHALHVAALVIGFLFFVWAGWATFEFAMESLAVGEEERGVIRFPIYPVKFVVSAGVLLLGIQFLLDAVREVLVVGRIATPEPEPAVAETEI